ncbi:MAG: hypothetical protein HS099_03415 [Ardenticatenaceae bacterium]|nr:hypothetical protein [Ardenticatenaceae bacterium]
MPPHSPPTPGRNRPPAVPPTKSTAVIADGRAPTFTSYAWPKPADGRTPTTKARPSLPTAVPPHSPPMPGRNRPTAVPPTKARPSLPTAVPPDSLPAPGPTRLTAVPPPQKSTAVTADGRAPRFTPCARPNPADGRTPPQKARPSLPTAVPPHSPPMPGPNRPTAVPPPQKARPSLPTAVPPDSLPAPGPTRLTAVPPPQKSTAVTADGRAPTFTSYAWQKPANGRTPHKKHGRHCRRPCPQIHSLRQAQPG